MIHPILNIANHLRCGLELVKVNIEDERRCAVIRRVVDTGCAARQRPWIGKGVAVKPGGVTDVGGSAHPAWIIERDTDAFAPGLQHAMQTEERRFKAATGPACHFEVK